MELLTGLILFWVYTSVGVFALAIAGNQAMYIEQDYGALTGIFYMIFWPIVIAREILRRRRVRCVKRVLSLIQNDALRTILAYELLGRGDGDRVLREIALWT